MHVEDSTGSRATPMRSERLDKKSKINFSFDVTTITTFATFLFRELSIFSYESRCNEKWNKESGQEVIIHVKQRKLHIRLADKNVPLRISRKAKNNDGIVCIGRCKLSYAQISHGCS